tara:strand:+ start:957 stop:1226 length:270 start_codon:yes stop_codon:yes gene_type:complete
MISNYSQHLSILNISFVHKAIKGYCMVFLSNPQVWHLPGTWSEQPIDGPYLGLTSGQLSWLAASLLATIFIALSVYILEMKNSKRKRSS